MEGAAPSLFSPLIFLGFLLLFMYIVIIRPQNKRNKEINEMLDNLVVGSEIIAASGILGKVKSIKANMCLLRLVKMLFLNCKDQQLQISCQKAP